jgi:hypothetical protein
MLFNNPSLFHRCASLYEQDEANVFAEPSVMSACLLPYLLQLAEKYPASSVVGERLGVWARENVTDLLENLRVCKDLQPGNTQAKDHMLTDLCRKAHNNTIIVASH